MALSIQQQIASIKNQLARLEEQIEEENKEKTFTITFEYKTHRRNWGSSENPDTTLIWETIVRNFDQISVAMCFYQGLSLKEVKEV
jgi:hypothetical protein